MKRRFHKANKPSIWIELRAFEPTNPLTKWEVFSACDVYKYLVGYKTFNSLASFTSGNPDFVEDVSTTQTVAGNMFPYWKKTDTSTPTECKHEWKDSILFTSIEERCTKCPAYRSKKAS